MTSRSGSSHVGSCLSVADLLAVVHSLVLENDDVLIFSKGHAAAAMYASLANHKLISKDSLGTFGVNGSEYIGHVNHAIKGVSFSTGSLGHGFPLGVGVALATKSKHIYVIISDGELNEGTTWESMALANQLNLSNLTVVIDANGIQSFGSTKEIVDLEPLVDKFLSFGWNSIEVDGHSVLELYKVLLKNEKNKPSVVIARTIKGKGIKEMEGKLDWHYRSPSKDKIDIYLKEIHNNA
jgi:transketolase